MGLHRVGHDWSDLAAAAAGNNIQFLGSWETGSKPKILNTFYVGEISPHLKRITQKILLSIFPIISAGLIPDSHFIVTRVWKYSHLEHVK